MAENIEPENNTIVNVSNFGVNMTNERLHKMFEKYGAISSYGIMNDDEPWHRFAYVAFEDSDAADEAVIELNGQLIDDHRRLKVKRKQRNEKRTKATSWSGKGCSIKNNDVADAKVSNDVAGSSNVDKPPPTNSEIWSEKTGFCIHVSNLDLNINRHQLRDIFQDFGPLLEAKIIMHQQNQIVLSRGYAFVTFVHENDARRAIAEKNNSRIGRKIVRLGIARGKKAPLKDHPNRQRLSSCSSVNHEKLTTSHSLGNRDMNPKNVFVDDYDSDSDFYI